MITIVEAYSKMMLDGYGIMSESGEAYVVAAVLTERITMGHMSMRCDHVSSSQQDALLYERVLSDINSVVTQLDLIHTNMTVDATIGVKMRVNEVSGLVVCGISSMVEWADRYEHAGGWIRSS